MTEQNVVILSDEDKALIAKCPYHERLAEALEIGVRVPESDFADIEKVNKLFASSKYVLLRAGAWSYIIGSNEFAQTLDPITQYDLALDGRLGSMLGCDLYTDAFMPPHLKDPTPETVGFAVFVPR